MRAGRMGEAGAALLAAAASPWSTAFSGIAMGWISIGFALLTVLLLIGDLHQPSRFFFLLIMPNTKSWLVRGGWVLTAHGMLSVAWAFGFSSKILAIPSVAVAVMTSIYTAFLFKQARGRELWCEDRMLLPVLAVQAGAAAVALGWFWGETGVIWLVAYFAVMVISAFLKPATAHAARAHHLMMRHPAFRAGFAFALLAFLWPPAVIGAFACFDHAYIKAGQEVPLS